MASCKFQRSGGSSCEQCGAEPKIQAGFVSAHSTAPLGLAAA